MYTSEPVTDDSERTAFRKTEKKYKIYYDNTKKKKIPRPVDLSEVVDFSSILQNYTQNSEIPERVSILNSDFDRPIFRLDDRPGFYFIPGALSVDEQCRWIRESLTSFPQPPNRTNHNAIYGPIEDLFGSANKGKVLVLEEGDLESDVSSLQWRFVEEADDAGKSVSASVLLRKLRWSTLGLQFDWSKVFAEILVFCYCLSLITSTQLRGYVLDLIL